MAYLVILALVVVIVFLLVRVLNLTDSSHPPKIISSDSHFTNTVLESCPIFFERYVNSKVSTNVFISFDNKTAFGFMVIK